MALLGRDKVYGNIIKELTDDKHAVYRVQDSSKKIGYIASAIHIDIKNKIKSNEYCIKLLETIKIKYQNSLIIVYIDANQEYIANKN